MTARHVHNILVDEVVAALRATSALDGVCIVGQNEQELATLIQVEEGTLDGVVAVVAVNEVEKISSRPAKYRVSFSVDVTEILPVNREKPTYLTAIDVAMECGEVIDSAHIGHFATLRHTTPGDGVLTAVAECVGDFTLETTTN